MKKCNRCKQEKNLEEFNFKIKVKGIRSYQCRDCSRLYVRSHYERNREYYLKKALRNNSALKQRVREYLWGYLSSHSCIDCGERDILVLEFDHQKDKYMEIGKMVTGRYSLVRIKTEVEKCEIRCANCHRRKTAIQQGWHKTKFAPVG